MKSYIEANLTPNEQVIYRGRVHWIVFIPCLLYTALAIIISIVSNSSQLIDYELGGFLVVGIAVLSLHQFIQAVLNYALTELVVTNQRLLAKWWTLGGRGTLELSSSQVESVMTDQPIVGIVLGFGTVYVQGTGGGTVPFKFISDPLAFRRHAVAEIDAEQ